MAKNKYDNYTKEQLIQKIKHLEKQRYGLVWEDKMEDVAEQCDQMLPVLHEEKALEITSDESKPNNILIEGDNYHALYTLSFTHQRKIDIIYIDPPYNTGAKDWKYNNNYVDSKDPYRHSKWLSFMNKRLQLAKKLLKNDGVVCVTIDDYEMPRLFILMEIIFGTDNHLGTLVIRSNPSGRSTVKGISITHEYALVFGKSNLSKIGRLPRTEKQTSRYDKQDDKSQFEWVNFRKHGGTRSESPKMYYPFYLTEKKWRIPKMEWNALKREWDILEKPKNGEVVVFPIDENGKERRWKWSYKSVLDEPEEFKVALDRNNNLGVYIKSRLSSGGVLPLTWFDKKEYSATAYGTNLLKEMFSDIQVFSYPKSLYAVMDCIRAMTEKKNALVLDFFAGSGTTGHAILELNKEDGGNRQFILCTNNENKICEEVTYPRIKKVIEGYNGNKGISANLKYYKTDFVPQVITDNDKRVLVNRCTELLCIAESTFQLVKQSKRKVEFAIYKSTKQITAIIYDEDAIEKCKEELRLLQPSVKVVIYVFSYDHEYNMEDFEDLTFQFDVKPIPEAILNVYRKNAKLKRK